jgi:hypothetical protein
MQTPRWIPAHLFWGYLSGAVYVVTGLCLIIDKKAPPGGSVARTHDSSARVPGLCTYRSCIFIGYSKRPKIIWRTPYCWAAASWLSPEPWAKICRSPINLSDHSASAVHEVSAFSESKRMAFE